MYLCYSAKPSTGGPADEFLGLPIGFAPGIAGAAPQRDARAARSGAGLESKPDPFGWRATEAAAGPRISFAVEFLPQTARPRRNELPVLDASMPDFPARLRLIGQVILKYEKYEPLMGRYRDLATRLIEWTR
jgi:hypothetical protein